MPVWDLGCTGESRSMGGDVLPTSEIDASSAGFWQRVSILGIDLRGDSRSLRASAGAGGVGNAVPDLGDADCGPMPVEREGSEGTEG